MIKAVMIRKFTPLMTS